ncbi:MAG: helix-turn-helix transcriptional regulator [Clostridiales bacterium]|nr:helix-turn-helix transcriptional regulator [Clostridiales bacterium]
MVEDRKSIGSKLVILRGNRSQKEVADSIGISVSALSMYETNNRVPRDSVNIRLADYYNVTVQELFFD